MHTFSPGLTTWHVTFGTYGTRLHGGDRPTVNRRHNQRGEAFVERDLDLEGRRRSLMKGTPVRLTTDQQRFIQTNLPAICKRGGWRLRACAACHDHVHVLLDVDPEVHGEKVRRLLKRWLSEALDESWNRPDSGTWWAEQGSNKPVKSVDHLNRVHPYIANQRAE